MAVSMGCLLTRAVHLGESEISPKQTPCTRGRNRATILMKDLAHNGLADCGRFLASSL